MKKRFCKVCGVERPLDDFLREGEMPERTAQRYYMCVRHDPDAPDWVRSRVEFGKAELRQQRSVRRRQKRDALKAREQHSAESYYISHKRRGQAARNLHPVRKTMTLEQYAAYLKSEHWLWLREVYEIADVLHECFVCGDDQYDLHHRTYIRVGEEALEDLVPLCRACHKHVHKAVKAGVKLDVAHTYVKMRHRKGQLGVRISNLNEGSK